MEDLSIPTVTQEDLVTFHVLRYGKRHRESQLRSEDLDIGGYRYDEENKDGGNLGYYSDGAKRTLTDEQITIFRHSEIQSLLRMKRLQKETNTLVPNLGCENEDIQSKSHAGKPEKLQSGNTNTPDDELEYENEKSEPLEEEEEEEDEEEYSRFLATERQEFESIALAMNNKRRVEDTTFVDRKTSTRRRVRELDAIKSQDEALDYGDEALISEPINTGRGYLVDLKISEPQIDTSKASTRTRNSEPVSGTTKGRKIWWPIIGK